MIDFLERMGSAVCHQMAERSFLFDGMQMPLCARCTGIYIGVFFAFCFFFWKKRMQAGKPFSLQQAVITGAAILPVGLDGVGSYLGFWESSQLMRVLTGSLVGAVVPGFLLMAGNFDPKRENVMPIYEKTAEMVLLLAVSVAFGLCLWLGLLQPVGAVLSVMGEVLLWGGLVWLVLKNLRKDSKMPCWNIALAVSFVGLFIMGGLVP
ncbi:DUF2085 domain-containing protein [Anaerotignum sp.]